MELGYIKLETIIRYSIHERMKFKLGYHLIKLIQHRLFPKMPDGFETAVTFPERLIRHSDSGEHEYRHKATATVWEKLQEYQL